MIVAAGDASAGVAVAGESRLGSTLLLPNSGVADEGAVSGVERLVSELIAAGLSAASLRASARGGLFNALIGVDCNTW